MQVLTGTLAQFPEDVIDMANEGLIETNFYDVNGMDLEESERHGKKKLCVDYQNNY